MFFSLFLILFIVCFVGWALGVLVFHVAGLIHLLLVVAVIFLVVHLARGQGSV